MSKRQDKLNSLLTGTGKASADAMQFGILYKFDRAPTKQDRRKVARRMLSAQKIVRRRYGLASLIGREWTYVPGDSADPRWYVGCKLYFKKTPISVARTGG
jgi:hypothetical protein